MRIMSMLRKRSRIIALILLVEFLSELGSPLAAYALTSGPNQPEFSSFEPVATTNMVNEFTGDFTYNLPLLEVPGPHGSGYPLSISYHSGVTQEEEASWVGFGWTLNAGAINRNTRGFPDDFSARPVTFHNKVPKNWTVSAGAGLAPEVLGSDGLIRFDASFSLRYNNYRGFGYNAGLGVNLPVSKGMISLGYDVSEQGGKPSFSLQLSPAKLLGSRKEETNQPRAKNKDDKTKTLKDIANGYRSSLQSRSLTLLSTSHYSLASFSDVGQPTSLNPYTGVSVNFSLGFDVTIPWFPAGASANVFGSYSSQENKDNNVSRDVFGYMYSAGAGGANIMDYQVEKDEGFDRRDVFLGQPFNMADNFIVSGEGIGGSFRMHHKTVGHFGPNTASSETVIGNLGAELNAGVGLFGGGVDVGAGKNTTTVKDWNRSASSFLSPTSSIDDEPVFFRFNGDTGGEWGTNYRTGSAPDDSPIIGTIGTLASINPNLTKPNNGQRVGRSSYIGFRTKQSIDENLNNTYSKVHYPLQGDAGLIGEFSIFNEAGMRYIYALPVYNKNEKNLTYGVQGALDSEIESRYIVYSKNEKTKIGEEIAGPYASAFLLTEITTPDYTDLTHNGPSQDDFGGYTRFAYTKVHSDYRWRIPFKGLKYTKNSLSDAMDDVGTVSGGEREVYYLGSIETKTHVAIFTMEDRLEDGIEAGLFDESIGKYSANGTKYLKRLRKIDLYSVESYANGVTYNADGTATAPSAPPIKTVHLEYYDAAGSLCKNAPNNTAGSGKLTLKRVFFEYNGIVRTRISPYVFEYKYPNYNTYPSKYRNSDAEDVTVGYAGLAAADQPITNPYYSVFNSDAWGNYQANGSTKYNNMRSWIDQTQTLGATFDPAPWDLKVIKLPSGGEIHVQYEQDDYQYVQAERAHVMAKVSSVLRYSTGDVFTISMASIGVLNSTDRDRMVELIKKRYKDTKNKIYFKFLYKLLGSGDPDLGSCDSDFVSGYADVLDVADSGSDIAITLKPTSKVDDFCNEFVRTQRLGKIVPGQNCDAAAGVGDGQSAEGMVLQLLSLFGSIVDPGTVCPTMEVGSDSRSYFRVPTPLPKKGGGLRVKRLLMYDPGMENIPTLYGNEYRYVTTDEQNNPISSGVTTNEPVGMREENILVDFIARSKTAYLTKLIGGDNKKQTEGPIGESIYPAPLVGYSRVITRNIHSGKTNPGFSYTEYFTAKDYPLVPKMTELISSSDRLYVPGLLVNYARDKRRAAQGFSFILNDMHGQIRRRANYSGSYDHLDTRKATLITEEQYEYFKPGEALPVQSSLYTALTSGTYNPGREVDVSFAQKQIVEDNVDGNMEVDFSLAIIPFFFPIVIPYPTGVPSLNTFEGELSIHATTKVVRYPAILKRTKVYQDGIVHTTENVAFDAQTGRPVAVKSYDEFKGAYLAQSVPAAWEYSDMGAKWKTEGKKLTGSYPFDGTYVNLGGGSCNLVEFTPGDIIRIGTGTANLYYVTELDIISNRLKVVKALPSSTTAPGANPSLTILFTARTNQLQSKAGDITFFNVDKNAIGPAFVDQANRYETNSLTAALQSATTGLTGSGTFPLAGPFTGIDMSAFVDKLPSQCGAIITSASVSDLEYSYAVVGSQITLKLMAFKINCGGPQPESLRAIGW